MRHQRPPTTSLDLQKTITMHYASTTIYTRTTPSCANHHAPSCANHHAPPTWIEHYALFLHPSSPYHAFATPHPLDHVVTPSMFHVHLAMTSTFTSTKYPN